MQTNLAMLFPSVQEHIESMQPLPSASLLYLGIWRAL